MIAWRCERNALSLCARACGSPHPCVPSLLALEKWCFENMHPYDAKSNFFSEVDVLRGRQSKRPGDAVFHATLVVHVRVLMRGPVLLAVLSRQNAHFCYCMRITFAYVFFSIHSNFHFVCIFTSAFSCSPLPPTWLLVVGLRQSGQSVRTECLFR